MKTCLMVQYTPLLSSHNADDYRIININKIIIPYSGVGFLLIKFDPSMGFAVLVLTRKNENSITILGMPMNIPICK